MLAFYVFGILTLLFLFAFCFLLDLLVYWKKKESKFLKRKGDSEYLAQLEEEHKRKKHPIKKNYLLSLVIRDLIEMGQEKKASSLLVFLREDKLLGIKKRSIHH